MLSNLRDGVAQVIVGGSNSKVALRSLAFDRVQNRDSSSPLYVRAVSPGGRRARSGPRSHGSIEWHRRKSGALFLNFWVS